MTLFPIYTFFTPYFTILEGYTFLLLQLILQFKILDYEIFGNYIRNSNNDDRRM